MAWSWHGMKNTKEHKWAKQEETIYHENWGQGQRKKPKKI